MKPAPPLTRSLVRHRPDSVRSLRIRKRQCQHQRDQRYHTVYRRCRGAQRYGVPAGGQCVVDCCVDGVLFVVVS